MLERTVFHNGQVCRYRNSIVRAKGCTLCSQDITPANKFDRILEKIMVLVLVFFTYHIEMALKGHRPDMAPALRSRFADHDISCMVRLCLKPQLICSIQNVLGYGRFILGAARDTGYFSEIPPYAFRFHAFDCSCHVMSPFECCLADRIDLDPEQGYYNSRFYFWIRCFTEYHNLRML